jgi:protein TonB
MDADAVGGQSGERTLERIGARWRPVGNRAITCGTVASFMVAVLLHAAAIGLLFLQMSGEPGVGGIELDAIGVEIVSSEVLNKLHPGKSEKDSAATPAAEQGSDVDSVHADVTPPVPEEVPKDVVPPEPDALEPQEKTPEVTPDKPPPDPPQVVQEKPSGESVAGGPTAAGKTAEATEDTAAESAAQAGALNRYLADIRSRLARNRPRGLRRSGVVTVTFAILPNGSLSYARVAKSSGSETLDNAALGAVERSAPFAVPPNGSVTTELVVTVPFRFD